METSLASTLRPALRTQLPERAKEPQTEVVKMSPERGARMDQLRSSVHDELNRPVLTDFNYLSTAACADVQRNRNSVIDSMNGRSGAVPATWMSAIMTKLDALWNVINYRNRPTQDTVVADINIGNSHSAAQQERRAVELTGDSQDFARQRDEIDSATAKTSRTQRQTLLYMNQNDASLKDRNFVKICKSRQFSRENEQRRMLSYETAERVSVKIARIRDDFPDGRRLID